jgi:RNA polymerase sigma-70 factor (ECF subfamily)
LIDAIAAKGELADYHLLHSARADLCRRLGRVREAADAYRQALALTNQIPERRFLERRLEELAGGSLPDSNSEDRVRKTPQTTQKNSITN